MDPDEKPQTIPNEDLMHKFHLQFRVKLCVHQAIVYPEEKPNALLQIWFLMKNECEAHESH